MAVRWPVFGVLFCLVGTAAAGLVKEPEVPSGWSTLYAEDADSTNRVRFTVQVREQNLETLRRVAYDVSDPTSASYGRFLSQEEIDKLTAPSAEDTQAVQNWLSSVQGVDIIEVRQDRTFFVEGPISAVGSMFQTSFRRLRNSQTGQTAMRAGDYILPTEVEASVSGMFGLHGLPLPPKEQTLPPAAAVTPDVITGQYKVKGQTVSRSAKNTQAVAEFQGQTMNHTDLKLFFKKFVTGYKAGDDKVSKFVGDPGDRRAQVEASLDIQYIMGVAPGIKTEFWLFDPMDFCSDLKNWTTQLLADPSCPLVHSVSYGWQGDLDAIGCKKDNVDVVDADFAKLAAKGISVIFASGDSGSGYSAGTEGDAAGAAAPVNPAKVKLYPSWPASSPWVTAVGATRFVGAAAKGEEMASVSFGSGGGFSKQFNQDAAQWQKDQVAHYLQVVPKGPPFPPAGSFPKDGRATPDVASLGEGFQVFDQGHVISVGGTSASAPLFAGLVSLLNEARLQAGKPAMGFLNPFLYQHGVPGTDSYAFTDVTKGTNAIGRGTGPAKYGYNCTAGWDPATGVGTPRFDKMLAASTALVSDRQPEGEAIVV
mmetsp:Transcript_28506/g.51830  ORF Transcript_28506/g.51830 Transcript_28506/m.51830 type:complete len:592 (-) Transcript_28506:171-1946(-)